MFDSPEELLRKIRLGEDTSLECKAVGFKGDRVSEPRRDDLADEIAAIANTAEGVLVLGVDDKTKEITGVPVARLDLLESTIFEICNESIKPPVVFRSYRMELPDSGGILQPVLKLEIPRSLFVHKSRGGYFHRQGSSKREMQPEVLARLFQQRSQARLIRFEEQAVPETTLDDLDESLWRRFLGAHSTDEVATLHKMKLLTKEEGGSERVTVAGILLCSQPGALAAGCLYRGGPLPRYEAGFELPDRCQADQRTPGPADTRCSDLCSSEHERLCHEATRKSRDPPVQHSGRV